MGLPDEYRKAVAVLRRDDAADEERKQARIAKDRAATAMFTNANAQATSEAKRAARDKAKKVIADAWA